MVFLGSFVNLHEVLLADPASIALGGLFPTLRILALVDELEPGRGSPGRGLNFGVLARHFTPKGDVEPDLAAELRNRSMLRIAHADPERIVIHEGIDALHLGDVLAY